MALFTRAQLRRFAPVAEDRIIETLVQGHDEIVRSGINTPRRLHHFLAHVATESGGLRFTEEQLVYSAERLTKVWPRRFPTLKAAKPYARNPRALANKVYGGRMGNTGPDDGWLYRGGGLLQTTGKDNYTAAGFRDNPDELRKCGPALTSALKFWSDNRLNAYADRDDIVGGTLRINGGKHGLDDRRNYLAKARRIFTGSIEEGDEGDEVLSEDRVRNLQQALINIGYAEVGEVDGRVGPKTIGAISMFQAERGLEITGELDEATVKAIPSAPQRVVKRASPEPLCSRILKHAGTLQKGAAATAATAGITVTDGPLQTILSARGYYEQLKTALAPFEVVSSFVANHPVLCIVAVCGGVYLYGYKIQQDRLDAHVDGRAV